MVLVVPDEAREPMADLVRLQPHQRDPLLEALAQAPPAVSLDQFTTHLPRIEGLSHAQQRQIVLTLMSLYHLIEHSGRSPEDVASEVVSALQYDNIGDLEDDENAARDFREFLLQLLSFDQSLGVTLKAGELLIENENNFSSARVVSDLRPVFLNRDDPEPRAAMVVHKLRIEIHETGYQYYFALDSLDIRLLQQVLQRAELKEKALKQTAEKAGLIWIER